MYELYYNLQAEPFRLSPDHRFCFNHRSYAKAKSYMQYAFHRAEGFVMITGRPGTGKTTLVNDLVDSLSPAEVSVAMLVSTQLDANDLLRMVAYSFGLEGELPHKAMVLQRLTRLLTNHYKEGRRALLIIDEAQDLSVSALEELRLLTNLQLNSQPLLQIFLLGQEELKDLVHGPNMEQVHQRLVAAYNLEPLKENETREYIKHRLDQVGWKGDPAISKAVFPVIYQFSHGIPRRINLFCSRLFLHGSVEEQHKLGINDAKVVLHELQLENLSSAMNRSDIDFETADLYESADLESIENEKADRNIKLTDKSPEQESIEPSIANESPVPSKQQRQHTQNKEQTHSQAPKQEKAPKKEKNIQRKPPVANHVTATDKAQNNTIKKQVVQQTVSRQQRNPDRPDKRAEKVYSSRNQVSRSHVVQQSRQTTPGQLDSKIEALDTGLDRLSGNVNTLLDEHKEPAQPTGKVETSAKPGNKFVTFALIVTVSLLLLTVVLFATTTKTLDAKIDAMGNWLSGITASIPALFINSKTDPEEQAVNVDSKTIATSPSLTSKSTSSAEIEESESQLKQDDQIAQSGLIQEDTIQKPIEAESEGRINTLSDGEKSPVEEEIQSTAALELDSTSVKESEDVEYAEDQMPVDNIVAMSLQNAAEDVSYAEPNRTAGSSAADQGTQQDDELTVDNIAEKGKEIEKNRLVKKVFFQFDSVAIQSDYYSELKEIAEQLDASPEISALVIGYSDNIGDEEYNLELSTKRARVVASYLASQGVSTDRLRTDGRGIRVSQAEAESSQETMDPDLSRMVEIYFISPVNQ
jgi:putative secretion ATPase (PEP-CTERM system associated)